MYYHSFIAVYKASVGDIIETAINGLTVDEQLEVVRGLGKYLYNQGAVSESVCFLQPITMITLLTFPRFWIAWSLSSSVGELKIVRHSD
jgi:hypothetical protein